MGFLFLQSAALLLLLSARLAFGLGSTCSSPLGAGTAGASDPFWLQSIKHQGKSVYNANPSTYKVFRNVKVSVLLAAYGLNY